MTITTIEVGTAVLNFHNLAGFDYNMKPVKLSRLPSENPADWLRFKQCRVSGMELSPKMAAKVQAFMREHHTEAISTGYGHYFTLDGDQLAWCDPMPFTTSTEMPDAIREIQEWKCPASLEAGLLTLESGETIDLARVAHLLRVIASDNTVTPTAGVRAAGAEALALLSGLRDDSGSPLTQQAISLATDAQLKHELVNRGYVLSVWSSADLDFLADEDWVEPLTDDELEALKAAILKGCGSPLKAKLGERGNEFLDTWIAANKAALLAEVLAKREA